MTTESQTQPPSFLYKLDPRTKITLTLLLTALVFIVDQPAVAGCQALVFLGLWIAAKLPLAKIRSYIKFLAVFVALIVLLQTLFGPDDNVHYILKPIIPETVPLIGGRGALKWPGLITGLMIVCRLAALVLLTPAFTLTTAPHLLAQGLTRLGVNYRAAYTVTTALNLLPSFETEARVIMDAQKLRGMRAFERGSIIARLRAYSSLAMPLIMNAMRRAELIGVVMDARAFGAHKSKTWLFTIKMSARDYVAFAVSAAYAAVVLALNFLL